MNDAKAILDSFLEKHGASWSEADRELAARIITRSAELAAMASMGGDPSAELVQLKAQLASLASAEAQTVAVIARTAIQDVISKGLSIVLKGLGLL